MFFFSTNTTISERQSTKYKYFMRARGQNNFSVMNEELKRDYESMLNFVLQVFVFIIFILWFYCTLSYDKKSKYSIRLIIFIDIYSLK